MPLPSAIGAFWQFLGADAAELNETTFSQKEGTSTCGIQ
jgi:hypothetical protein